MNPGRYRYIILSLTSGTLLLAGLFLLLGGAPQPTRAAGGDLFVTPGGGGDCSQGNPCALQTALERAGDGDAIYMAAGTYTGTGEAVITITHSITLYGGWDGTTTTPVVRDPAVYPATLDGEGQRRVVFIYDTITVTLDGLTLVRGNAANASNSAGQGGGIYSGLGATPIIANCVISGNVAYTGTSLSGVGGGIHVVAPSGAAVITGNHIVSNVASLSSRGTGGGISILGAPGAQVVNNVILSNTAAISADRGYGGGLAVEGTSQGTLLAGNLLRGNVALARSNGYGRGYGGGLDVGSAAVLITGNEILSNTAAITGGLGHGGGVALLGSQNVTVTGNTIEYNVAQAHRAAAGGSYGGGIYCYISGHGLFGDNTLRYNIASKADRGGGGGIALWWYCERALLSGNLIQGNSGSTGTSYGYGGGVLIYDSHDLQIRDNRILSNTACARFRGFGGGLYLERNVSFTMTNNIVAANHASYQGGGIALATGAEPLIGTLVHNTFVANDRGSGEGRVAMHLSDPRVTLVLTNNLIYSHTTGITVTAGSTATLDHTLFYAHSEGDIGGDGVIVNTHPITGQDPLLNADNHLSPGSPAIDAGINVPWVSVDIDGDPRPIGPAPDIGADETYRYLYLPLVLKHTP